MARYINASDTPSILGSGYGFYWAKQEKIYSILNKYQPIQEKRYIDDLQPEEIEQISNSIKQVSGSCSGSDLEEDLNKLEDKICHHENDKDYLQARNAFINTLPTSQIKLNAEASIGVKRGNIVEEQIINRDKFQKTNNMNYYSFSINNQEYKIGGRFDVDSGMEIKTRLNRFLGVKEFEKVQCTWYMKMSNLTSWILRERYNDQEKDHVVSFDEEYLAKLQTDLHNAWESHRTNIETFN
tara:strand:+ start:626 stop:1345 length:720 start_codon:yes stop_codon:yes gene_type:complete